MTHPRTLNFEWPLTTLGECMRSTCLIREKGRKEVARGQVAISVFAGWGGAGALSDVWWVYCRYYPPCDVVSVVVERSTVANPSLTGRIYPHHRKNTGWMGSSGAVLSLTCVYAGCTGKGMEDDLGQFLLRKPVFKASISIGLSFNHMPYDITLCI